MPIPPLPSPATIGFLHTSPLHPATFDGLLVALTPSVHTVHVIDESLLAEARHAGITPALEARVIKALQDLARQKPSLIVCTCSTIGPVAEAASAQLSCSVIRVDRPMAEAAIRMTRQAAGPVVVAAALASTVEPTVALLESVARADGTPMPDIRLIPCFESWDAFERGNLASYGQEIAQAIEPAAAGASAIVLAQASMMAALPFLRHLRAPILTSPAALVAALGDALPANPNG